MEVSDLHLDSFQVECSQEHHARASGLQEALQGSQSFLKDLLQLQMEPQGALHFQLDLACKCLANLQV